MNVTLRDARREDIPVIVEMLADDVLGSGRESAGAEVPLLYYDAFDEMAGDPNNRLLIAEHDGAIVGTLQLTFIRGLSRQGAKRAQIEGVRVASGHRGEGLGEAIFRAAIGMARAQGCNIVQLTTDKQRADAHRFYEKLGFRATHEGMKLALD